MTQEALVENLRYIIRETLWMARRYADGRRTFAPTAVNEAIELAKKCGIEVEPDTVIDGRIYAKDGDLGAWVPERQRFEKE